MRERCGVGMSSAVRRCLVFYPFVLLLLAGTACSGPLPSSQSPATSPPPTLRPVPVNALVIENGAVIDGTGAAPIPDGIVVIQGDRVAAVGPRADFAIPTSAQVVDAMGGTILP